MEVPSKSGKPRLAGARLDVVLAIAVSLVAAVAGSVWVALSLRPPESDALVYFTLAKQLIAGQGYVIHGIPTAYWNAGYPLALAGLFAVFGASITSVAVFNVALHAVTAVLAFILAVRLNVPRWIAVVAGVAVGLYPDKLFVVSQGLAENLAVPLVLVIALCWVAFLEHISSPVARIAPVGVLLGLLTLTRTVALALLPLFVVMTWVVMRRRGEGATRVIACVAVLAVSCGLVLTPWLVRNYVVLGAPVISTIGGPNLLIALRSEPPGSFQREVLEPIVPIHTGSDEVRADREYMARALRILRSNPWKWLRVPVANAKGLFITPISHSEMGARLNVLSRMLVPVRVMLVLVALLALGWRLPSISSGTRSIAAFCVAWALVHVVLAAMGSVRYMIPISPLMIVLAAYLVAARRSSRSAPLESL